ncbi:ribonuclease P protein component [Rothia nasimurium]|uniref:ribonuclease P protein component n=1 Tax=Rothia nasimurium TaxID=85336 RepID=UPI001F01D069|nr:ribonuclease P protein component [Rothia nasimurium]
MLAQQHRMRASAQFSATTRSGARSGRRNLVLYTAKTDEQATTIGFIVSKAVGNAVTRNTTKRRLREAIAPFVAENPTGYSIVVRALPPAATASYRELAADLTGALAATLKKLSAPQAAPPNPTREEL